MRSIGSNEAQRFEFRNHTSGKLKNVHKFENLGHINLVTTVCLDLISVHIYVKYMQNRQFR